MRDKFSEEVLEAGKLEKTVSSISHMISEFLQILESQSETVQDMHAAGKNATEQVEQTDKQLALTLERSQSHNTNMIIIIMSAAILLLLLDYLTH